MQSQFGNAGLVTHEFVPSYSLASEPQVLHVTDDTTIEEIEQFYRARHVDGPGLTTKMTARERLEYYRTHFPKMEYKGFVFYMDLAPRGTMAKFLTVRDIEVENGLITLYKAVPREVVTAIEMFGFDPNAPKRWGPSLAHLETANSGKQYFSGSENGTAVIIEHMNDPVLLTTHLSRSDFNAAEFVFNGLTQMYTSRRVDLE